MAEGPSASRKKDKNQHIQVFVRVRPTNHAESVGRSSTVVEVPSTKEVVVRERPQDKLTKKFTFDKVFGPSSKQVDVYTSVVSPLLDEVLAGYNCTVFAYGQTGTGKTFTMEGVDNDPSIHWKSDSNAGIIPRALSHLFDELRMLENHEFTVRVSFLELYNEELFDLLSPTDEPQSSKIRIYEDAAKKGAVIIHGLEEVTVHSKSEVYKILEKGSEQRKTSATLMNAHSSRSHTVFSITIHIKENTVEGEELIKIGKLNLVDLAGSENVGRSGAVKRRAMEAGNINQSLLTLGRVITALVERAPHIPYRESKLTRLLQESLGGRTKTSIIATVSPAGINLEETLSTLDYAHRAKNITNRPEINQKLSKRELLKEYTEEIERLRRDLQATRERNGVYIAQDNYNEMQSTIEAQGKEIEEKINHIKALEDKMMVNENTLKDLKMDLENTKQEVKITKQQRDEREHLVLAHVATEKKLTSQAQTLLNVAKDASTDVAKLHDKIERKRKIEEENASLGEEFHDNITQQLNDIQENFSSYSQDIVQFCLSSKDQLNNLTQNITQGIEQSIEIISHDLVNNQQSENERLETHVKSCNQLYKKWLDESIEKTVNLTEHETELLRCFFLKFSPKITELVETSVADNLKKINEDNSIKMDLLMNLMKTTVDKLSSKLLIDRDRMEERITTVSKISDDEIAATKNIMNEKEEFFKEFQAFTKKYKNLYDEDKNIAETIIQKSTDTIDICENIKTDIQQTYADVINIKKFVDENVSSTVDEIKQDLSTGLEVNWKIAENSIDLSKKLAEEMKKDLKNNCDILEKFKDTTESRINEFKAQIEADKSTTLVSTKNITEIVSESSVEHKELMNNHKNSMGINVGEIIRKFEDKSGDSIEWNDNLSSSVGSIKNHIGKFIVQDLRKYEPTGSTPAKKDFRYPSQLVSTSPHERIIRRFRQNPIVAVETALGNEAMDTSLVDGDERMKFASLTPCDVKSKNTPSNESLTRAASTSNLSTAAAAAAGHEPTTIVRSISDITKKQDNKENSDNEFLKPDIKTNKSTLSKLKYCPKKILSSHND